MRAKPKYTASFAASLVAAAVVGFVALANAELTHARDRLHHLSQTEKSAAPAELITVVEGFIAAGQTDDPNARAKYLAPNIFFYGHACTRAQATREMISLYRRWPKRKFGPLEDVEMFAIPKQARAYKVTAIYEYEFGNLDEHLTGKSKLTFVIEHDLHGTRIIGVDEKLLRETTKYYRQ